MALIFRKFLKYQPRRYTQLHNMIPHTKLLPNTSKHRLFCTQSNTESKKEEQIPELKPTMNETISTNLQSCSFQTETQQLLDIVANSLYTDREVFLRELLSNASDALEKLRYNLNKNDGSIIKPDMPLEINVYTDKDKGILIVEDAGIGMNNDELASNLGTIARSGSKTFVKQASESGENNSIIGQFGVGFYSVFMVSNNVDVYSCSADIGKTGGWYWHSDGTGKYDIGNADNVKRGTKIVVHLKDQFKDEFADKNRIQEIIKKYSSYLLFPIKLNGSLITSSGAIWSKQPSELQQSQYTDFYQLITNRYDDPYYIYHSHFESSKFAAQCLIYFPSTHEEKFGGGRIPPGINMYCRKVLVKKNAPEIIPDWLRFIKGAVDSENIPIHISRENMQDSELIRQLKESIMMKIIDYLKKQMKKDIKKYNKWYNEFAGFIKEGVCSDYSNRSRIAKLLRYQTNLTNDNDKISLDDYVDSMNESDKEIYYIIAPNRESAMNSPYMETFHESKKQVLFCYAQIDEFVMRNLGSYKSKDIIGIETSTLVNNNNTKLSNDALTEDQCNNLGRWIKKTFPDHINKVEMTYRLVKHPAVLVDHQSQSIRAYLNALGEDVKTPAQRIQINPNHNIIKGLYKLVKSLEDDDNNNNINNEINEKKAKIIGKQLINNAYIAAGILDDPREMLINNNLVIELSLGYTDNVNDYTYNAPNITNYQSPTQELEDKINQHADKMEQEKGAKESKAKIVEDVDILQ